jgi:hypothetical protein
MHEALLAAGAAKLVYPNSGPGPISAVGTDDVAFFGEVSNAEVLTADEFKAQIPEFFAASVTNDNIPWLKFRYYGKFLFIKKQAIFTLSSTNFSTSWISLYRAGLIYGEEGIGPGVYPFGQTDQLRIVKKGSYSFKVRTITGDETGLATQVVNSSGSDASPRRKSMFTELLYRVSDNVIPLYPEKKFAKYPWQDLIANIEINREILLNASYPNGTPLLRGSFNGAAPIYITGYSLQGGTPLTSAYYWRPVLELIAQNELFKLGTYRISVAGFLRGAISGLVFGSSASGTETTIVRLADFDSDGGYKKPVGGTYVAATGDPNRLTNFKASRELKIPLGVVSSISGGDPARLMSIKIIHTPIVRVSNVNITT